MPSSTLVAGRQDSFSFYLADFGRYDVIYGCLGAVAAFLFWMCLSAMVLLFVVEAASEYPWARSGKHMTSGGRAGSWAPAAPSWPSFGRKCA